MDETLQRILSLIPKKPDGKYVRGAKKDLAEAIGAPANVVMAWEHGDHKSYNNYLYKIANYYNVSVEWLEGKTDEKSLTPAPTGDEDQALLEKIRRLSPEMKAAIITMLDQYGK